RTRRAAQQISIELLEGRRLLAVDPNLGWIKIDLSQLDQTGVGDAYDIYVQGNSAGMFIQPLDGKLMFAPPQPGVDLTLPANSNWTFDNPGALFVGGNVTFLNGTTSVGTTKIKSIAANVKVAAYNASNHLDSRWETTAVFNAFNYSGVTSKALVAINSGGMGTGIMASNGIATLTGFNIPAAASSVFTLGSVVVGNSPDYMFPNNNSQNDKTNGNGPSWTNPTYVTQIDNYSSSLMTADATLSSGATGTLSKLLQVYQNGIGAKYATLPAIPITSASVPVYDANGNPVGQAVPLTIDNLLSTNQLPKTASPTYDANGVATISWQVQFQGNAADKPSSTGLLPVYSVDSYTVTFDSPPPANATKVTFHAQIGATILDQQSFTIDTSSAGFPGLSTSTLFIGMPLVITPGTGAGAALTANVTALAAAGSKITVTLEEPLPVQFTSGSAVTIALPPTGGTLTATKVDSSSPAANAIWVKQTNAPVESEGKFSLNGSRIYFSLVPKLSQPQAMTWVSSGSGIAVNQWTPAQIWSGAVPASVYTELTVDDFSGTEGTAGGDVYFDLSGVDGFFFPAGISYQKNAQTEWVVGQPWKNYSAPNTKGPNTYGPVTRSQLIAAFQGFFGSAAGNFSANANAQALAAQYKALVTTSKNAVLGIKNPSFAYSSPTSSVPAFDTCWNPALDALFTQGNQIDMIGDDSDPSNSKTLYYKGMSTSVNSSPISGVTATGNGGSVTYTLPQGSGPLIPGQTVTISGFANAALNGVFTLLSAPTATTFTVSNASVTQQTQGTAGTVVPSSYPYRFIQFTEYSGDYNSPTGGVFYVFDPRTPPPSETAAYSGGTPMSVGYQVFGNTGVFASTQIVSGSPHPNSNGNSVLGGSALAQLAALQRDIVTALNRGMGGFGIGQINGNSPSPGASTNYWQNQNNWYPYAAPYGAQTPQNIYSQWFHTAVIAKADQTYTVPATYPLGDAFGDPQKSWGGGVQSGGPYMNMYYGFGYDEKGRLPSNANTNAQFPGINNTAGNTLSFGVVLGPWNASTPTKPGSPTSVVAKSGNASLGVTWAAPASPGSSPI
ncbi:MAG: hypothetical protein HQ464_01065, partial [Planctomycetes bacterium]|nr:hypothetical protein [Planctomycetota bacterium]